jgi:hypothetical protein
MMPRSLNNWCNRPVDPSQKREKRINSRKRKENDKRSLYMSKRQNTFHDWRKCTSLYLPTREGGIIVYATFKPKGNSTMTVFNSSTAGTPPKGPNGANSDESVQGTEPFRAPEGFATKDRDPVKRHLGLVLEGRVDGAGFAKKLPRK